MGQSNNHTAALALGRGRNIDAADVIALLREVYADGIVTLGEAEELIAFDHSLTESTADWREFFAASIADHVLKRQAPAGSVDEGKAERLMQMLACGRATATGSGFAALLRVLETAPETPPLLAAHVLDLLRMALIAGTANAVGLPALACRKIDAGCMALLARVLAAAGKSGRALSRAEAEALFDLHDAVAGSDNEPGFDELFFHSIVRYVGDAAPLDAERSAWLASRIMRDGRPTAAEHALLRLISREPSAGDPASRRSFEHAA